MIMRTAAKLKISLANNVLLNLDALLSADGREAAVIAELSQDSILSLLKKEMPCTLEDAGYGTRQGLIRNIFRNGKKQLLEVGLLP
jgi:hypothetical protein